jgi:hypothetical protein
MPDFLPDMKPSGHATAVRPVPSWRTHPKTAPIADDRRHTPDCDLYRWFHPPLGWARPVVQPACTCGVDAARKASR